jgi:hypothetical protein
MKLDNLYNEILTLEQINNFKIRLSKHIYYVQMFCNKLSNFLDKDTNEKLFKSVINHDKSKFESPEFGPYVLLNWSQKCKRENKEFNLSKEDNDDIIEATLHHIKNNAHHPEYWSEDKTKANLSSTNRDNSIECINAFNMPKEAIAEMLCDWAAMSFELKTNTIKEWYNKVKDVRWSFSKEQEKFIESLIFVLEN